jgi:hypothetical protein
MTATTVNVIYETEKALAAIKDCEDSTVQLRPIGASCNGLSPKSHD